MKVEKGQRDGTEGGRLHENEGDDAPTLYMQLAVCYTAGSALDWAWLQEADAGGSCMSLTSTGARSSGGVQGTLRPT